MNWVDFQFDSRYEININGQVRNKRTLRFTKSHPDKDGYFKVVLWYNNKRNSHFIHRLIAQHFIKNLNNLPQINHLNGNKQNNKISNLEWCDASRNRQHSFDMGLQKGRKGIKHHNVKLNEKQVKEIIELAKIGIKRKIIATKYNIHKNHIYRLLKGTRWGHLQ